MPTLDLHVGVLGLGAIGSAVATNLVKAGIRTSVWNRSPEPMAALVAQGATGAEDVAALFASCDIVLSVLFDDAAVRAVVLDSGVLDAVPTGAIHVGMSTISTALVHDLVRTHVAHGLHYVGAPVFGRPDAAQAADLAIALGGPAHILDRVEPVLRVLGKTWRIGAEPHLAHLAKITGNLMIISAVETMREAAAMIEAQGGAPAPFLGMMGESLFNAPIYRSYGAALAAGAPPMRSAAAARIVAKDLGLAVGEAAAGQADAPLAGFLRQRMGGR